MRELEWLSSSQRDLYQFPKDVVQEFGYALYVAQMGGTYHKTKPLRGFDSHVYEIAIEHNKNAYRVVYLIMTQGIMSVIHAFQKKSKRGIKTPKEEIDIIHQRLKQFNKNRT